MGWQSRLGRAARHVMGKGPIPPLGDNAFAHFVATSPRVPDRAPWKTWLRERAKAAKRQSAEARDRARGERGA